MVPGAATLELTGPGWKRDKASMRRAWYEFSAHEVFHIWNVATTRTGGRTTVWLREGAANFAAGRALRENRFVSEGDYERRIVGAANHCLAGLKGGLAEEISKSAYSCGELLLFLIDRELDSKGGAFPVLTDVFDKGRSGGRYSNHHLLEALAAKGGKPKFVLKVKNLLFLGLGFKPIGFVQRELRGAGIETMIRKRGKQASLVYKPKRR